ncbi:hypothetical protein [Methylovulum psychrotolerans]|uniref:Uncharacterized protein n=1 Tax=Methylovulum psychrotolerans TaxID=1704499 RepID=A0A2S5CGP4_9GAMM|nr:hypothetical protein [Methylovulum psychrotolerans]POZ49966.1 hypothetical protein AADEFJLK_04246 [Methylovulum psychrotolerans]
MSEPHLVIVGGPNGSLASLVNSWQLFANTGEGFDLLATGKGHQVTETAPDLFMRFIASLESL